MKIYCLKYIVISSKDKNTKEKKKVIIIILMEIPLINRVKSEENNPLIYNP